MQIKLLPFTTAETAEMLPSWNVQDGAIAHAITGGIPYYLSFINTHNNITEAESIFRIQSRRMRKMLLVGEDEAIYFILSESGFAEDLEAIAKNRDDIHLITGENLFGRK